MCTFTARSQTLSIPLASGARWEKSGSIAVRALSCLVLSQTDATPTFVGSDCMEIGRRKDLHLSLQPKDDPQCLAHKRASIFSAFNQPDLEGAL